MQKKNLKIIFLILDTLDCSSLSSVRKGEHAQREKASDSSSRQKCTKTLSQFVSVLDARIPNTNTEIYVVFNKMALLHD